MVFEVGDVPFRASVDINIANQVLECQAGSLAGVEEDDVNGWITLGFALGNMLFDCICLLNFFRSHKQTGRACK